MSSIKSLTIDELIAQLTKYPHDTKVFMAKDPEGNGYSSLNVESIDNNPEDKAIILWPAQENIEADEILPIWWEAQE